MNKLAAFLNNMDAKAWRTIWVSVALLGGVAVLMILGKSGLFGWAEHLDTQLQGLRDSPWGLPATVLVFILTAFIAAPQFVLMGACVVAFGPWLGSAYAMAGQMVTAWLHFYMGRWGGRDLVERYGGNTVNRLSSFIGRNDFLASTIVRSVPTAPAIVVNMAFGASKAGFWPFIVGCFFGSIPKTLIVALLGQSVMSAMGGGLMLAVGGVIAVISIWVVVALAARRAVHRDDPPEGAPAPEQPAANPNESGA
jgi:uncharacterized membrane protein YdjX (TVP38/TMEM64 family)